MNKDLRYILIGIGLVALISGCYMLAEKFNKYYSKKYGCKGWTWPYAAALAVLEFFAWYLSFQGGKPFMWSLVAACVCAVVAVAACVIRVKKAGADIKDIFGATVFQLVASLGAIAGMLILIEIPPHMRRPER